MRVKKNPRKTHKNQLKNGYMRLTKFMVVSRAKHSFRDYVVIIIRSKAS